MEIADKIVEYFKNDPDLSILFFFDSEGEYREELVLWGRKDIEFVMGDERYFSLKIKLEYDLSGKKVFLYFPMAKPRGEAWINFPLLDLYYANKELVLDDVGEFLQENGLPDRYSDLVKKYIKELKTKKTKSRLAKILHKDLFNEQSLKEGLICSCLDFESVVTPSLCIAKLFVTALDENKLNLILNRIEKLGLEETLDSWLNYFFDENTEKTGIGKIKKIAGQLKYNVLTRGIGEESPEDTYKTLKIIDPVKSGRLHSLFTDWQNYSILSRNIPRVFNELASDIHDDKLIEIYGVDAPYGYYTNNMKLEMIKSIAAKFEDEPAVTVQNSKKIMVIAGDDENLQPIEDFLYHASSVTNLLKSYSHYKFNKAEDYIDKYKREFYLVDYHYRKAILSLSAYIDPAVISAAGIEPIREKMHEDYEKFLIELNREWLQILKEDKFNFHEIKIQKQWDFYHDNLSGIESKAGVIISDAFRYESAVELFESLMKDERNEVHIDAALASVPSYTSLGMANLLPNKKIEIKSDNNEISFYINNRSTEGIANRQQILLNEKEGSVAVSSKDIIGMTQQQGRELVKNNRLIYIYHNRIDATGDSRATEKEALKAVEESISELKQIIRLLNNWNLLNIFITADHGFLYNHNALSKSTKQKMPELENTLKKHNRFIIAPETRKQVEGYKFALSNTSNAGSALEVIIPLAINRFERQGSGDHFVHGGASLQEVIIPVIKYRRKRTAESHAVGFRILNSELKIVSGSIRLLILQDRPVNNEYKKMSLVIGLYSDDGRLLSGEKILVLDSTDESPKSRKNDVILSLDSEGSRLSIVNLKIFDAADSGRLNPLASEKVINKTLIAGDFL